MGPPSAGERIPSADRKTPASAIFFQLCSGMLVDRFDDHGLALYLTGGLLLSSTIIEVFFLRVPLMSAPQYEKIYFHMMADIICTCFSFRYLLQLPTSFMRKEMIIHSCND